MKIFAIEASGKVCGAALCEDGVITADVSTQNGKTHSQTLVPMMDEIRKLTDLDLKTIDAIALTKGPGSFTGIRIGAATAKGFGLALEKPLIPVPTVDAIAYNLFGTGEGTAICPILDARRSQVYTGIYCFAGDRFEVLREQCVVGIDEISADLNGRGKKVIFAGDGVPVYRDRLKDLMQVPYAFAPMHLALQRAATTAALAWRYYEEKGETAFESADAFRPEYLRLSQAERERLEGIDTSKTTIRDAHGVPVK